MTFSGRSPEDPEASATPRGPSPRPADPYLGARLEGLARTVAVAGGVLLIGVVVMTVISVFGRYLFNAPIPGDYELTELACGIAVFAFFPYCHARNGNIVVEFFTGRMRPYHRTMLDTVHAIVFTVAAGLITWRMFVGAVHKLEDGETTLFLGVPVHWAYFSALFGAGLLTAICLLVVCRHVQALRR